MGALVPADVKLISEGSMKVDQSGVTGESLPITKYTGNECLSGCYVTQGSAEAVVYATGENTFFGKTSAAVTTTPSTFTISDRCLMALFDEAKVFPCRTDLSTIKKLNVMAFDKTGVLTQNKLSIPSIGLFGDDGIEWIPSDELASHELKEVARMVVRCCSAGVGEQPDAINHTLDQWSHNLSPELDVDRKAVKKPSAFFPFNPATKYSVMVYDGQSNQKKKKKKKKGKEDEEGGKEEEGKSEPFGFARGAAQLIFKRCNSVMINGEMKRVADLSDIEDKVSEAINEAAARGWRCLGLVSLEGGLDPSANIEGLQSDPLGNISCWKTSCFLGLIPFVDPLRKDAAEHVRQLAEMGMKILILTGDALSVTKEVARSLGWKIEDWAEITRDKEKPPQREKAKKQGKAKGLPKEVKETKDGYGEKEKEGNSKEENEPEESSSFRAFCMTPDDFDELEKEDNFVATLSDLMRKFDGMVLAQAFPEHKYALVDALQKEGFVVGMVGDGVNDAPAMKKANVSFAPAGAADAANAVADFILTEPELGGIVRTIEILRSEKEKEGKCVVS